MARAIGSPLSDYHGLVSRPDAGLRAADVLRAADLGVFRYTGLIDPVRRVRPSETKPGHVIAPGDTDAEAYLEASARPAPRRSRTGAGWTTSWSARSATIAWSRPIRSREAFDQLIAWKREQLERTGVHDFLRPDWTRGLLLDLFQRRPVRSRADDQPLCRRRAGGGPFRRAAGRGVPPVDRLDQSGLGEWSPGQIFFMRAIAAMPGLGLHRYDLGPGHDHYKGAYA
jgi:CelD/BcsL family acetyltransferase involved in cellulose biosynthesis